MVPKLVFEMERKNIRLQYQDMMLKKHQFGFLKNSNSKKLSDWVDGSVLSQLKEKLRDTNNDIDALED